MMPPPVPDVTLAPTVIAPALVMVLWLKATLAVACAPPTVVSALTTVLLGSIWRPTEGRQPQDDGAPTVIAPRLVTLLPTPRRMPTVPFPSVIVPVLVTVLLSPPPKAPTIPPVLSPPVIDPLLR